MGEIATIPEADISSLKEGDSNRWDIYCKYYEQCRCIMLKSDVGVFRSKEFEVPDGKGDPKKEDKFVMVDDIFCFENIGFLNNQGNIKYLACAECDRGPVGYQLVDNPKEIFVALSRVKLLPKNFKIK